MEALWVWKKNVQKCAAASGVLVLSLGTVFGNLSLENTQIKQNCEEVSATGGESIRNQRENLLQLKSRSSLLDRRELQNAETTENSKNCIDEVIPTEVQELVLQTREEPEVVQKLETQTLEESEMVNEITEQKTIVEHTETLEDETERTAERNVSEEVTTFLVDEEGMLYDLNMDQLDIEWGYLEIPDYCQGIRSGALAKSGECVEEIFLPASVNVIEPAAFSGMSALGWIETAEDNFTYCSKDGVLFTKDMTTLVAFPANATGIYRIPTEVIHIESKAFEESNISVIDSRQCDGIDDADLREAEALGITII